MTGPKEVGDGMEAEVSRGVGVVGSCNDLGFASE